MPDGNNMNIENQPINKRSTRRQFGKLLLASLGLAAAYKPLKWIEERDKQLQPRATTAATATPNPDSVIPNAPTPEATSQAQRPLPLKEVESLRQEALLNGQERIPLPEGFNFKDTTAADGNDSISCIEEKRLGWFDFPALAEGELVTIDSSKKLPHINIFGIRTKEGTVFAFAVPKTAEVIARSTHINMGDPFLKINHNPFSEFQTEYEKEGGFDPDTVVNIKRLKMGEDGIKVIPQSLSLIENVLSNNGRPITISSVPPLPMPKSQQA